MAAALLEHHAARRVEVRSAGSAPADAINPAVRAAMAQIGIDLYSAHPNAAHHRRRHGLRRRGHHGLRRARDHRQWAGRTPQQGHRPGRRDVRRRGLDRRHGPSAPRRDAPAVHRTDRSPGPPAQPETRTRRSGREAGRVVRGLPPTRCSPTAPNRCSTPRPPIATTPSSSRVIAELKKEHAPICPGVSPPTPPGWRSPRSRRAGSGVDRSSAVSSTRHAI
jgi:hypothetical protein